MATLIEAGPAPHVSLRERNKARTHAELEEAALELFVRHGFDRVTVDDIAAASGVSRRTFFRYFDSKEDVLLADQPRRLAELRSAFLARPDEPLLTAVRNALLTVADGYERERQVMLAKFRIMYSTPSVLARSLERQVTWESTVAELVAARLAVDASTSMVARVIGASAIAAVRVAINLWLDGGGAADLHELSAEALDVLVEGLHQLA